MAEIQGKAEILAKLTTASERMQRLNNAARLVGALTTGGEPAAQQPSGVLGPPPPAIVGEPPRPSPSTR